MKLTGQQRKEIQTKLAAGSSVADLASEYKVSRPLIYKIRDSSKPTVTAVSVLEQEIAGAESRIGELKKILVEIEGLQDEIKVKRVALESLKKLEKP